MYNAAVEGKGREGKGKGREGKGHSGRERLSCMLYTAYIQ